MNEFQDGDFFSNIQTVNGSRESIINIAKSHELVAVTSRPEKIEHKTKQFLKNNFPHIVQVLHSFNRSFETGRSSKAELCLKHGISLLIEDDPFHIDDCEKKGVSVIIFDRPWNQKLNGLRACSWQEVENLINRRYGWEQAL